MSQYTFLMQLDYELDADLIDVLQPYAASRRMRAEIRRLLRLGIQADAQLKAQGIVLSTTASMSTAEPNQRQQPDNGRGAAVKP